ncbi:protein MOS2-like [Melia azedarach]|uniref:Protein MOS2-like n=2 Tax=Melia azedarach TaxID=155640 RepID=A0ACC1YZG1_MELAZ|nr:protein MOS2-like [Melia azedarach]KAJ4729095.1 protein MOS2-like [Melia azedarach]
MNTNNSKVSFSVRSKPSSKPNTKSSRDDEDQPKKEFVTEFDPEKTLTNSKQRRIIIPPKVNEGPLLKKTKNLELPIAEAKKESDQLQWELERKNDAEDDSKISYGLNLRSNHNDNSNSNQDAAGPTIESVKKVVSKDFKHDLERLRDDEGFEQYEDMPVEEFGAALLGGLGWYEGRGIGKNSKGNVKIKEFGKKSFVSDDVIINKDKEKNGLKKVKEPRDTKIDDRDKQVKHQESLKQVDNRREGVKQVDKRSRESEKQVDKQIRETEKRESSKDKGRISWLRSHIRVRIISKDFKKGRLYLKKGEVVDVVGPTTCDISMDEGGELVQGVEQDVLESALPRRGGAVLVLHGRHKGIYGNLVDRDLDRETGVVRDADTHELLNVKLEQIAEYIGDPSYIGY